MKKATQLSSLSLLITALFSQQVFADVPLTLEQYNQATNPEFKRTVVVQNLNSPHNLVWGGDNNLWLTEQTSGNIVRINPNTGAKKTIFTVPDMVYDEGAQYGLLGIALDPKFNQASHQFVYVSVSIKNPNATDPAFPNQMVIRRYTYDAKKDTLVNPVDIIKGLPCSRDHQSSRLVIGPDNKIYYTIGDQGSNQLTYLFKPNLAQKTPTKAEVSAKDWHKYAGKILRLNLDGSIPSDNPYFDGVQSHIYTIGHRNAQGLSFAPNGKLLQSEQSANSDDEINLIVKGGNYGWPYVAGYKDNNGYAYANFSAAKGDQSKIKDPALNGLKAPEGVPVTKESEWSDKNFIQPLKTLFTVGNDHNFNDPTCGEYAYVCWPTVAASSAYFYKGGKSAIPGWENSLLVTSLKRGVIFRIQLDDSISVTKGDAIPMFRSENRYRDIVASPNGNELFVITDNAGSVQKNDGTVTKTVANPGALIKFTYQPK
nr:glucose/sorbosone family PQQ-dependent dehydrogenase [Acinetobacter sp. Marseille-Q1620]